MFRAIWQYPVITTVISHEDILIINYYMIKSDIYTKEDV